MLRTLASLILGLLILCAAVLLFSTMAINAALREDIYLDALAQQMAYDRVYTEVLTPTLGGQLLQEHLPDPPLLPPDDVMEFVRGVAPPEYLQKQTEGNLRRLFDYINGERSRLDLYLDLSEPLERIPNALEGLIETRSTEVLSTLATRADIIAPNSLEPNSLEKETATDLADELEAMLTGENLSRAFADYTGRTEEELFAIVDEAIDKTLANPEVPVQYREELQKSRIRLREAFAYGSTREFLREAVRVIAGPAIEAGASDLNLDERQRLDLTAVLARQILGLGEADFQSRANEWRDRYLVALNWARTLAVAILLVAVGLLVLVHWGRPRLMLLWTAWALAAGGILLLAGTLLALWQVPGVVHLAISQWLTSAPPWAPEFAALGADVASQALKNLLVELIWPAATPLVAGGLILAALWSWQGWESHAQAGDPETGQG